MMETMKDKKSFYDDLSSSYDAMINFNDALKRRKEVVDKFIDDKTKTAADIGCGTGMDSISMALNNLRVTAFDISPGMIQQAKKNAEANNVKIDFHNYEAKEIPVEFNDKFDLVISLGNTLANISGEDITQALKRIYSMLKTDGKFIFQVLNYQKVINEQERIVNITGDDKFIYVRFYDFLIDRLNFNILKFEKENFKNKSLITTSLLPLTMTEAARILQQTGFKEYNFYGNLNLKEYDLETSSDLVCIAIK